jgi:hypothetical protein
MQTLEQNQVKARSKVSNPPFITRYTKIRQLINEATLERKELEAEIIEWGKLQLEEATNTRLPIKGTLGKQVELSLASVKPKEADALKGSLELRQLQEEIAEDKETTLEQNEDKINELISQMEELQQQIHQLSYSEHGHQLIKEYNSLLKKELRKCPCSYQVRYKELPH